MIDRVVLPETSLELSRLSFGTASLHHLYKRRSRQKLLRTALDAGITHFDTSPYYGYGLAEKELGSINLKSRDNITIATKVGLYPPGNSSQGIISIWSRKFLGKINSSISKPIVNWHVSAAEKSFESSLKRLKTECIDILFLHEPNPTIVDTDEFLLWLEVQREKGKLKYWGLAGYPDQLGGWLAKKSPLGNILQIKDSLDNREADLVYEHNRKLQITFGYLSSSKQIQKPILKENYLIKALKRNKTGSVLFSTRKIERIKDIATWYGSLES